MDCNVPTSNTFIWTWASFCFTFLALGGVLFIYQFWLNTPDATSRWKPGSRRSGC